MTTETGAARLARLVVRHQPCVVLTGAGVSTESGVPDFRSPTGIWAQFDPLEYATLGAFERDPEKVWRFYAPRFAMLTSAEPNAAHLALAELERLGLVRAVVTQNIDLLHERAGSREVIEVHGSIRTSSCRSCGADYPLAEVASLLEAGEGAPRCPACGTVLKPGVVFFDELLPEGALERAHALAEEARLLLVVGSSLEVHPVAGLPQVTLAAGGEVAVLNRTPTSVDRRAALVVRRSAGEVLGGVVAALGAGIVGVSEYDPEWPRRYEEEAARVRAALGDGVGAVEHMGSTAVPGLAGKPVVDLSVGLRRLELSETQVAAMEALGYEYLGEYGLPGRLFFRRRHPRPANVHVVEHDGEHWHRHRAVRDYLRAHPREASAYAAEKRRIAADARDLEDYWERKQPFADALCERAWAWYAGRR
ncbi:MAG TPA: NAD-dependent protein deacylase [Gaiellaceae bacterium]|nr:NAD-dependent protein deacylase [Gaiellaceae bacterium]